LKNKINSINSQKKYENDEEIIGEDEEM